VTAPLAGPFYFHWVNEADPFDASCLVMDEYIFHFECVHAEGAHCALVIEIENRGLPPLGGSLPLWCYFAWDNGTEVIPLFKGRLVAVPSDLNGPYHQLEFLARPSDYDARIRNLSQYMKELPYYDVAFIDPNSIDDPNNVLIAVASNWHTDRVTHAVTLSDILVGEDGVEEFGESDIHEDNFETRLVDAPLSSVDVSGTVKWTATASGSIPIGVFSFGGPSVGSIISGWPKTGEQLAGGWAVASASAARSGTGKELQTTTVNVNYQNEAKEHRDGDTMELTENFSGPTAVLSGSAGIVSGHLIKFKMIVGDPYYGTPASLEEERAGTYVNESDNCTCSIALSYGAGLPRTETLSFRLVSDLQDVLFNPEDTAKQEEIKLPGIDVGTGSPSIMADTSAPSYFASARGRQSAQYLALAGLARLKKGGRVVKVAFDCDFGRVVTLNCRKNAHVTYQMLVNGESSGKITQYSFSGDGDSGEFIGNVVSMCCIGTNTAVVETPGTAGYVDDGYVDDGYYQNEGEIVLFGDGNIGMGAITPVPNVDGITFPLDRFTAIKKLVVHRDEFVDDGQPPTPRPAINAVNILKSAQAYAEWLDAMQQWELDQRAKFQSWLELEMVDLTGSGADGQATAEFSHVQLPNQYDMTGPS